VFTENDFKARIKQQPFVPMRIVTSSGQTFDVHHPELIMAGRRELIIGTASADNPASFDGISRVAIMHVTAIQDLPVASPSSGNGQNQTP
jgi:hypothetical protein